MIALSLSEFQRSSVNLRCELADDLPPIAGDRTQLQQVVLNLLRNAVDAMSTIDDRPRELLFRTERDGENQVRLRVRDSGVGFTSQTTDKIFDAFYTTKTDGMGIGSPGVAPLLMLIKAVSGRHPVMDLDLPSHLHSLAHARVSLTSKLVSIGLIRQRTLHDLAPILAIGAKAIPKYNGRPS